MGRCIDNILQPGEKILYSTTIHAIVYVPGLACLLAAAAALAGAHMVPNDTAVMALLGASILLALLAGVLLARPGSGAGPAETSRVTTLRLVYKEGFIRRQTFEMSLDKIESVDVAQGIAGRLFGWGDVTVMGVGEGRETIRMIASPIEFRNHITAR